MRKTPFALLGRFLRDREGSFAIEAVLTFPMLAWALLACFSYFDGLRQANVNIKAANMIADMLSRETQVIDDTYIGGLQSVMDFLVHTPHPTSLRISVFTYHQDGDEFALNWSKATGSKTALTANNQAAVTGRIPLMADSDTVIIVETWMDYQAPFVFGLDDTTLYNLVVTSPRYAPQLLYAGAKQTS